MDWLGHIRFYQIQQCTHGFHSRSYAGYHIPSHPTSRPAPFPWYGCGFWEIHADLRQHNVACSCLHLVSMRRLISFIAGGVGVPFVRWFGTECDHHMYPYNTCLVASHAEGSCTFPQGGDEVQVSMVYRMPKLGWLWYTSKKIHIMHRSTDIARKRA